MSKIPFPKLHIDTCLSYYSDVPNLYRATVIIGGCPCHVEFIEVDKDRGVEAVNPDLQDRIDGVRSFDDGGRSYYSVLIEDRPHFVVMHPFQN
jgi:hypothetical protein